MADHPLLAERAYRLLDRLGPVVALAIVWSIFASREWDTFATWANTQSILLQTAVVGVAALGGTLVIISGGIDLSVGSLIALASVVVALVLKKSAGDAGAPSVMLAVAAGIALAGLCGLAVGAMVTGRIGRVAAAIAIGLSVFAAGRFGLAAWQGWAALLAGVAAAAMALWGDRRVSPPIVLSPFIVTLGMWGALRGIAKGLANNSAIYPPQSSLTYLMRLPNAQADASLLWQPWNWWSPGVWIFIVLTLLTGLMLRYTQFGRHVYAIGSNEQTARLCGVNVERTKTAIYMLAALLTGVAGVLQFSYNTMGDPMTAAGYELEVIAAVVIGGASLSGGVGGVMGTVVGALLMKVIENGCTKLQLEMWIQDILTGGIIIAAVALDQLRQRASRR